MSSISDTTVVCPIDRCDRILTLRTSVHLGPPTPNGQYVLAHVDVDDEPLLQHLTDDHAPVHRAPLAGQETTVCCNRSPFDLPRWHRMTIFADVVTCGGSA